MARVICILRQRRRRKDDHGDEPFCLFGDDGRKTLLIDFDPQYNATVGLGIQRAPDETIYHILLAGQAPERAIKDTYLSNLQMIPASLIWRAHSWSS